MSAQSKLKTAGRIAISTLFWLIVQGCILMLFSSLKSMYDRAVSLGTFNLGAGVVEFVFMIGLGFCILVYTIVGAIILEKTTINSRRWWITLGICYAVYVIITTVGMSAIMGDIFLYDFVSYVLTVWFAPLLWLAEIEIVHLYWFGQRKKYLGEINPDYNVKDK